MISLVAQYQAEHFLIQTGLAALGLLFLACVVVICATAYCLLRHK